MAGFYWLIQNYLLIHDISQTIIILACFLSASKEKNFLKQMVACFSYYLQLQGHKQNFKVHALHVASFKSFHHKPAASYKGGMATLS